ncbi:MAG: DUF4389 domain-containing protein [Candidatus Methanoperedens sp.]|nr:DUF4389 domain-containing protein [Candidatus Methanoperedens sp.]
MNEESGEIKQLFVYESHASRLELLIRILYWIAIGIVLIVYRNEGLSNLIKGYLEYLVYVTPYIYFMTDRRPEVLPKTVKIYEKEE